ncbi:MAG TPA: hypothetical protein VL287_14375 [Gemmatimonadales bacterium]|jgi:hypothetical protein|nr:hypothetical protein [Gemmatimonadales bacterium]HTK42773.1 hypothetical protein [Gemmatimonadales bacterium]
MAISPKMLAVLRKVEAASEAHLANIRERGKAEKARAKLLLQLKRKPPVKKPPIRANEKRKAS